MFTYTVIFLCEFYSACDGLCVDSCQSKGLMLVTVGVKNRICVGKITVGTWSRWCLTVKGL